MSRQLQASGISGALAEGERNLLLAARAAGRMRGPARLAALGRVRLLRDEGRRIRASLNAPTDGLGVVPAAFWVGTGVAAAAGMAVAWVKNWLGGTREVSLQLECIERIMRNDPTLTAEEAGAVCNPQRSLVDVPAWAWGLGIGLVGLVVLGATRR